jgi:hypothetical protein
MIQVFLEVVGYPNRKLQFNYGPDNTSTCHGRKIRGIKGHTKSHASYTNRNLSVIWTNLRIHWQYSEIASKAENLLGTSRL